MAQGDQSRPAEVRPFLANPFLRNAVCVFVKLVVINQLQQEEKFRRSREKTQRNHTHIYTVTKQTTLFGGQMRRGRHTSNHRLPQGPASRMYGGRTHGR